MTQVIEENGKQYTIEDGRVVEASAAEPQIREERVQLKFNDRVQFGKKQGKVVSIIPSVYGNAVGVRFDDGSVQELLEDALERINPEKVAGVASDDDIEATYREYQAMPINSQDEIEEKLAVARRLNVTAKALATNQQNALADTILYDTIVTGTAVDILDLKEAAQHLAAATDEYVEGLPRFRVSEMIAPAGGNNGGGDMSWIGMTEFEVEEVTDADLAGKARQTVSHFTHEQLDDVEFMRRVLSYSFETLPQDATVRTRFAKYVNEARKQKLAEPKPEQVRTASLQNQRDLDGNEVDLTNTPIEAVFGV